MRGPRCTANGDDSMLKLYKRIKRVLHYHEAWAHGAKITEHWGIVGERGETALHKRDKKLSEAKNIEHLLAKSLAEGFKPIDADNHATLLIEYPIEGIGSNKDLKKRHALEERMNETLGWTGLGDCDGGSIGSGTMEVCCLVVDFKIARRVIEEDLKNTKFADYSRIYDERVDPLPVLKPPGPGTEMLAPPWIMFPGGDRSDASWQSGKPAKYLAKWMTWYRTIPVEARTAYSVAFREPKGWSGFYESLALSAEP
jgi:hypothetical protein